MNKKLLVCIVAVVLAGTAGLFAATIPGGLGLQNGSNTGSYAGVVWDSDIDVLGKPVILYLGYGSGNGICVAAEHWLLDNTLLTFGQDMSLNWHWGYGAYVTAFGAASTFRVGAYPLIGLNWVWDNPIEGVDRIDVFGNYEIAIGLKVGGYSSGLLDLQWYPYTGGFRVYF
jgi:hypothetical protein